MKTCLVEAIGFLGDSLFCIPTFKKLKEEQGFDQVHFYAHTNAAIDLISQDEYLDKAFYTKPSYTTYDKVYTVAPLTRWNESPPIQFQKQFNIKNTCSQFYTKTPKIQENILDKIIDSGKKKIITYQGDWNKRRWLLTEQEIKERKHNGQNVRPTPITLRPQSIDSLLSKLVLIFPDIQFIPIGPVRGLTSIECLNICSHLIKRSALFIGAEGGLANLASSLRTKVILDTTHMELMFGKYGVIAQTEDIQLGPAKLFPGEGHIHLDPYINNDVLLENISENIKRII